MKYDKYHREYYSTPVLTMLKLQRIQLIYENDNLNLIRKTKTRGNYEGTAQETYWKNW